MARITYTFEVADELAPFYRMVMLQRTERAHSTSVREAKAYIKQLNRDRIAKAGVRRSVAPVTGFTFKGV